jgi:hypothetical protein
MESRPVLLVAGVDCAKGKEKEFNDWYDSTFPQIMMRAPGVVRVDRYERLEDNDEYPMFLSVVQIESEEVMEAMEKSDAVAELAGIMLEQSPKWEMKVRWVMHYRRFFSTEPS